MSFPQLRRFATLAGAVGGLALLLQLLLTIRRTLAQGGSVLGGVWIYLDYFTILTNALAAAALLVAARGRDGSVLARGAVDGRYPYPFLDVGALGLPHVIANAAGVALAFVVVGAALVGVQRWRAPR